MNKIIFSFFLLAFTYLSYPQDNLTFDTFTVKIDHNKLIVTGLSGEQLYSHTFYHPSVSAYDLDDDGLSELLLKDTVVTEGITFYRLFIYNTVDSFYVIDSINSGSFEPYETVSEELGSTIIITGEAQLDSLNINEYVFLPINCWKVEGRDLFLVNDDLYENFMSENESIVDFLEEYYSSNIKNCNSTEAVKSAVAAGYINFLKAGEKSIASQFIKKYYLCSDSDRFMISLKNILRTKDNL